MRNYLRDTSLKSWLFAAIFVATLAFTAYIHVVDLDKLPAGLYVDESSIGLNAANIQQNLRDEHGKLLPIYFEAFGEYKNPVYIYTSAALFQIFGISEFSLRLTSLVFFLILTVGSLLLVRKIFPKHPLTWLYTLVVIGTLPWLFTLSRISFEVISQPAILVWALYFIYSAYQHQILTKLTTYSVIAAGLLVGLSTYTYSTSRLLSFALIAALFIVYRHPEYWKRHVFFLSAFIVSLIPYIYFALTNPGALTTRLSLISYFYDDQLSLWDKLHTLIVNYLSYFDPTFLLIAGDQNLRHHTGSTGQIYLAVAVLAIIGVSFITALKNSPHKYFGWFLILNLLAAPLAAAMTESNHALRSLLMGFFIVWISVYGLAALELVPKLRLKQVSLAILLTLLVVQIVPYLNHYFGSYRQESIAAFESFDFKTSLTQAINQQPQQVVVTDRANAPYAHVDFYSFIVSNPHQVPVDVQTPLANPDTCLITFNWDATIENPSNLPETFRQQNDYSAVVCY